MAPKNYQSVVKNLKNYGKKNKDKEKLMEEYIKQTDKNYKDGDKN